MKTVHDRIKIEADNAQCEALIIILTKARNNANLQRDRLRTGWPELSNSFSDEIAVIDQAIAAIKFTVDENDRAARCKHQIDDLAKVTRSNHNRRLFPDKGA